MDDVKNDISSKVGSSGWHIALARATPAEGHHLYLGDTKVVSHLVRSFVAGICDRYAATAEGRMAPGLAPQQDQADCHRMASLFAGQADGYLPVGDWNPSGLAAHLRLELTGLIAPLGEDLETIAESFAVLVHSVYDAIRDHAENDDTGALQSRLSELCDQFSMLLLSVEQNDDQGEFGDE